MHVGENKFYVTVTTTAQPIQCKWRLDILPCAVHTFLWFVIHPTLLMSNTGA